MKASLAFAAAGVALTFGLGAAVSIAQTAMDDANAPIAAPIIAEQDDESYLDAPQTPGDWVYDQERGESLALYQSTAPRPVFTIRCSAGVVSLGRASSAGQSQTGGQTDQSQESSSRLLSISTETVKASLDTYPVAGPEAILVADLDANDPLLDAMAITKGRFAVEVEGEETLYLPAWVEVSRVIEDCR